MSELCEPLLVDEKEAARRLGISPRHLRKYKDKIPIVRFGRRKLYDPKDLKAFQRQKAREWTDQVPPKFLHNSIGGIVYFIDCEAYTKIGFTAYPLLRRFKQWRNGNPFDLKLFALLPGTSALEQALHKQFSHCRIQREWFALGDDDRDLIRNLVLKADGAVFGALIIGSITV